MKRLSLPQTLALRDLARKTRTKPHRSETFFSLISRGLARMERFCPYGTDGPGEYRPVITDEGHAALRDAAVLSPLEE